LSITMGPNGLLLGVEADLDVLYCQSGKNVY